MSNIVGTITRTDGTLFTGKLYVTLSGAITTNTSPKGVSVPTRDEFDVTNGDLNIVLIETETPQVSYRFELFDLDGLNLVEPAYMDFYAIVPNETTVQFADLIPTGIKNSQLDSGALRIANTIISNPVFVEGIKNLSKPVVIVRNSINQTINSSIQVLDFDTETSDVSGVWDANRFTVPSGFNGTFLLSGVIPINNASGSSRNITIAVRTNNTTVTDLVTATVANNQTVDIIIPRIGINLNSTDYIELVSKSDGGFTYTSVAARKQLLISRLGI